MLARVAVRGAPPCLGCLSAADVTLSVSLMNGRSEVGSQRWPPSGLDTCVSACDVGE